MATYDKDTQDFIDSVAGKTEYPANKEKIIRQGISAIRDISRGHHLSDVVAKRLLKVTTSHQMRKEASPSVSVLKIYETLNDRYTDSWQDWEPETLWQTLEYDQLYDITEQLKNMIQALQVVCKTNFPFEEWNVFENVGHAFNGNSVSFGSLQPLELNEVAWTCRALEAIRPGTLYEDEVDGYIAACMKNAGMVYIPSSISKDSATINSALNRIGNDESLQTIVSLHIDRFSVKLFGSEDEMLKIQLQKLQECIEYADAQASL